MLYPNLDKWGQFNETHYGILPIRIQQSERADEYFGFVDEDSRVRIWANIGSREVSPENCDTKLGANLFYPPIQKPFSTIEGESGTVLSSSGVANTFNDAEVSQIAAYYPYDGLAPVSPERMGLDARIVFGLFRVLGNTASDEIGEVVNLMIRSLDSNNTYVGTGFNLDPPAGEDLNQDSTSERFVEEAYVNHKLRLIGTIDGETLYYAEEPTLTGFVKSTRYYSCSVPGLWHMIELRAEEVGESFHPVTVELTAIPAGRLN